MEPLKTWDLVNILDSNLILFEFKVSELSNYCSKII